MAEKTQNFENHVQFAPAFHFFVMPVFLINLVWAIVHVFHVFTAGSVIALLVALALPVLAGSARTFALKVQDRLIRLEMRLRLQEILPPDLRPRIPEFTVNQLVSLRFASDEEMPELARRVLTDKINDRKAIKKLVRSWQPDLLRA
jgi:Family of unknown function (DUF6526)